MHGLTLTQQEPAEVKWKRLEDVRGSCDQCAKDRPLTVEYIPTSAWICQECFREYWLEADARPA